MNSKMATDLVRAIASGTRHNNDDLMNLGKRWGIEPRTIYPSDGGRPYFDPVEFIRVLAQRVTETK